MMKEPGLKLPDMCCYGINYGELFYEDYVRFLKQF